MDHFNRGGGHIRLRDVALQRFAAGIYKHRPNAFAAIGHAVADGREQTIQTWLLSVQMPLQILIDTYLTTAQVLIEIGHSAEPSKGSTTG